MYSHIAESPLNNLQVAQLLRSFPPFCITFTAHCLSLHWINQNPAYNLSPHSFKKYFNIIFPSTPKNSIGIIFLQIFLFHIYPLLNKFNTHNKIFYFITLIKYSEESDAGFFPNIFSLFVPNTWFIKHPKPDSFN
jgi:hypothetical protein